METVRNDIPSSEGTEPEPISNNYDDVNEPTITNTEIDSRINCTDSQSLRNIYDIITLNCIDKLVDACNLTDSHSEIRTVLYESFKNAFQENILVNGLPFLVEESKTLSSAERNDHSHMVDDVLFGKLSKRVSEVAQARKFYPERCCRIKKMVFKHQIQSLKRTKVTDLNSQSTAALKPANQDRRHLKIFSDVCQSFGTEQETVQCKLQEIEKLAMKLKVVKDIEKKQKNCPKLNKGN